MSIHILEQEFNKDDVLCVYNNVLYAPPEQPAVCVVFSYDADRQLIETVFRLPADVQALSEELGFFYWGNEDIGELATNPSFEAAPELNEYVADNAEHIQEPGWNPGARALQRGLVNSLDEIGSVIDSAVKAAGSESTSRQKPDDIALGTLQAKPEIPASKTRLQKMGAALLRTLGFAS